MNVKEASIVTPCTKTWDDLEEIGESACRFCSGCDKVVHNLSELKESDAKLLVEARGSDELCVVYDHKPDGTIHHQKSKWKTRLFGLLAIIVPASPMMTACGGMPRGQEHIYIEQNAAAQQESHAKYTAIVRVDVASTIIEQIVLEDE